MKVKTLRRFSDLLESEPREVGDEFEVNKERFDQLNALNLVAVVEEKEVKKPAKKKKGD